MNKTFVDRLNELYEGKFAERIPQFENKFDEKGNYIGQVSYSDLAVLAGTSKQVVSNWFGGTNPQIGNVITLANSYGVTTDWLLGKDDEISHSEQTTYELLKKIGVSSKAYEIIDSQLKLAPDKLMEYVAAINCIVESSQKSTYYKAESKEPIEFYCNDILQTLADYLRVDYELPSEMTDGLQKDKWSKSGKIRNVWITATSPETIAETMSKCVRTNNYDRNKIVPEITAFNEINQYFKLYTDDIYRPYCLTTLNRYLEELLESLKAEEV